MIKISITSQGRIAILFFYNSDFIQKIKLIKGYKWQSQDKYWGFPNSNEKTLKKLFEVFKGKKIHIELRKIKGLLEHKIPKITEIYTHVSNKDFISIRNSLDQILQEYRND